MGWRTILRRDYLPRRDSYLSRLSLSLRLSEHHCDPFNNGIDIGEYFEVPKSQHLISIGAQELASALVLLFLICVLRTIKFDNQTRFQADEVGEEWAD